MEKAKLREIHIKSFKSFAKLVSLKISEGITAIVGPNGSGKSNILNAIEFALGSLRFSSLRAKSAKDLIYHGQKTVAKEAFVEVVFEGNGAYFEDGKMKIKRRLKQDGSSVYYLNDKRATRLKVLDALASINLFPDAHNIVNQGDINKFAEMTPKDRYAIFEKIAGIELYERKKEKALKELEDVENRLKQVDAVLKEKKKRFEKVKKAYEKLQRYLNLNILKKRAEYTIKLKEKEKIENDLENLKNIIENHRKKLEELNEKEEEYRKELDKIKNELNKLGANKILEFEKELSSLNTEITHLLNRRREINSKMEQLKYRKESIIKQIDGIKRQIEVLEKDQEILGKKYEELKKEVEELEKQKEIISKEYSEKLDEYKKLMKEYEEKYKLWEERELKKRKLNLELENNKRRVKSIENEIDSLNKRYKIEKEKIEKLKEKKKEAEKEIVKIDEELKKIEDEISNIEEEILKASVGYLAPEIEELISKGYKNIPEYFNYSKESAAFYPIFINKDIKLEKGWVAVISEEDAKELIEFAKKVKIIGKFSEKTIKPSKERIKYRSELQRKLLSLKKIKKELEDKKLKLMSVLNMRIDSSVLVEFKERIKKLEDDKKKIMEKIKEIESELSSIKDVEKPTPPKPVDNSEFLKISSLLEKKIRELRNMEDKLSSIKMRIELSKGDIKRSEESIKNIDEEFKKLYQELEELNKVIDEKFERKNELKNLLNDLKKGTYELREKRKFYEIEINKINKEREKIEIELARLGERIKILEEKLKNIIEEINKVEGLDPVEEDPYKLLDYIEDEIKSLGSINFDAEKEYKELEKEVGEVTKRLETLFTEKEKIIALMEEIDKRKEEVFNLVFNEIKKNFEDIFSNILNGEATLIRTEEGIDIDVFLKGRHLSMNSLSGGEKTLTAIAFIFAINSTKPSPIFVFDEVDAALDKANSRNLVRLLRRMSKISQIIIITHNDIVVSDADQIIGVFIDRGSSKIIALPKERILKEPEIWISKEGE